MAAATINDRLQKLLDEAKEIPKVNDGTGHNNPAFKAWRRRSQAAIEDKLGPDSRPARELAELKFFYKRTAFVSGMPPVTPQQHKNTFARSFDDAVALLTAALESDPRQPDREAGPFVHIEQIGSTAIASASADLHVEVTVEQLRQLVATEEGLSPEDRSQAIGSLPDDPAELTVEKVEKLLNLATKAKRLFKPLLAWLITHADRIPWPK